MGRVELEVFAQGPDEVGHGGEFPFGDLVRGPGFVVLVGRFGKAQAEGAVPGFPGGGKIQGRVVGDVGDLPLPQPVRPFAPEVGEGLHKRFCRVVGQVVGVDHPVKKAFQVQGRHLVGLAPVVTAGHDPREDPGAPQEVGHFRDPPVGHGQGDGGVDDLPEVVVGDDPGETGKVGVEAFPGLGRPPLLLVLEQVQEQGPFRRGTPAAAYPGNRLVIKAHGDLGLAAEDVVELEEQCFDQHRSHLSKNVGNGVDYVAVNGIFQRGWTEAACNFSHLRPRKATRGTRARFSRTKADR